MANPDIISQLVHELVVGITEVRWINYTLVPSITLMVYDWLLILNLEVSLVWNSPWGVTKVAYFLARYLPFLDISLQVWYQFNHGLSPHACEVLLIVSALLFYVGHSSATMILTLRTWAACKKGRKFTFVLFGFFGVIEVAGCVLIALYLRSATLRASPVPQFVGCIVEAKNSYLASLYVVVMVYEASLLVLMIAQRISTHKYVFPFRSVSWSWPVMTDRLGGSSGLTRVVYRDGILYYIYVFGLSLLNTVIMLRLQGVVVVLMLFIEQVIYSLLACRVVLHIREQGQEKARFPPSEQISGPIRFASEQRTAQVVTGASEESDSSV